MGLKRTVAS